MHHDSFDTIVAQATAPGGPIGIIRLSGADSASILKKIFYQSVPFESHKLYHGFLRDPSTNESIDEVMVVYMKGPHSFTGEDVCEIHAHGSPAVLKKIIELCFTLGARQAEPGEFSKRSFLNGKIDLSQAEAICDLISSASEQASKNALSQLDGFLGRTIKSMREKLIHLLSALEVGFDFSEDDVTFFKKDEATETFLEVNQQLQNLIDSFQTGLLYRDGIKVALVGKPNVGKSSLLNALINQDRAIIHNTPGTTRDVVEGERIIDGYRFLFFDTAGIRDTTDDIEQIGINRSREALTKSAALLLVLDTSRPLDDDDKQIIRDTAGMNRIIVLNKSDEKTLWRKSDLPVQIFTLSLSAKTRVGLDELLGAMKQHFLPKQAGDGESERFAITNLRHLNSLQKAQSLLTELITHLAHLQDEIITADIMAITRHLGAITGEIDSEVILDEIFSRFCIGK